LLFAGALSDKFGRKRLLIGSALLFVVTSIGNGLAGSFTVFVAWRMLGGVAIGLASSLSPMYIAEVAPERVQTTEELEQDHYFLVDRSGSMAGAKWQRRGAWSRLSAGWVTRIVPAADGGSSRIYCR
jgi:MFS family permease